MPFRNGFVSGFAIQKRFKHSSKLAAGAPVEAAGEDVLGFAACDTR